MHMYIVKNFKNSLLTPNQAIRNTDAWKFDIKKCWAPCMHL